LADFLGLLSERIIRLDIKRPEKDDVKDSAKNNKDDAEDGCVQDADLKFDGIGLRFREKFPVEGDSVVIEDK